MRPEAGRCSTIGRAPAASSATRSAGKAGIWGRTSRPSAPVRPDQARRERPVPEPVDPRGLPGDDRGNCRRAGALRAGAVGIDRFADPSGCGGKRPPDQQGRHRTAEVGASLADAGGAADRPLTTRIRGLDLFPGECCGPHPRPLDSGERSAEAAPGTGLRACQDGRVRKRRAWNLSDDCALDGRVRPAAARSHARPTHWSLRPAHPHSLLGLEEGEQVTELLTGQGEPEALRHHGRLRDGGPPRSRSRAIGSRPRSGRGG